MTTEEKIKIIENGNKKNIQPLVSEKDKEKVIAMVSAGISIENALYTQFAKKPAVTTALTDYWLEHNGFDSAVIDFLGTIKDNTIAQ